jgi:hypothetical protein
MRRQEKFFEGRGGGGGRVAGSAVQGSKNDPYAAQIFQGKFVLGFQGQTACGLRWLARLNQATGAAKKIWPWATYYSVVVVDCNPDKFGHSKGRFEYPEEKVTMG